MADLQSLDRKILHRFEKAPDLEVVCSEVEFDSRKYFEIREYIPSLNEYGRGILIDWKSTGEIAFALEFVTDDD